MNFWQVMTGVWIAVLIGVLLTGQWVALGPTLGAISGSLAASLRR